MLLDKCALPLGAYFPVCYQEYPIPPLTITRDPLTVLTPILTIVFGATRALAPTATAV
ncbi:hypothetical protein SAMN06265784_12012 [Paraburkholderia susongensis]|uniref:Uncharacterized protein n=1 Tax=Paraburkholderia susongensis TaxID=1515439 RepID=A0A1X7M565_9BURK|nr:hypothetical protein SAMN06265784_12012 [Paraburkholderia susongensis]